MLELEPIACEFNAPKRGYPYKLLFESAASYFYYYYYSRHYYLFIITIIARTLTYKPLLNAENCNTDIKFYRISRNYSLLILNYLGL